MECKAMEKPRTYPMCVFAWGQKTLDLASVLLTALLLFAFDPSACSPPAQWCAQDNLYLMLR